MNIEMALLAEKDVIKCIACGECCPSICPSKKGTECEIHPTIVGKEARNLICSVTPVEIFINGINCPPVAQRVTELIGQTPITNKYFCSVPQIDSQQLRAILNTQLPK